MDKLGHVYSSYMGGFIGKEALLYAGLKEREAILYGGGLGFLFLSTVEVFDGYSEEWGFSWGDIASNAIGTSLLMGQELLFQEQIIIPKFSYSSTSYSKYRPNTLGSNFQESLIKDYNGQTYWLSVNLNGVYSKIKPNWLNLAMGFGASGLVSSQGDFISSKGELISQYRQFYLSPDIDLTKVKSNKKIIKTLLKAANFVKLPSPTLEFNEVNGTKFHWLFF